MGYARIRVSIDLLRERLSLPREADIKGVGLPDTWDGSDIELTIAHPDLADVPVGDRPPLIRPTFRKREASVDLIDWGQETTT
jgi:hypothetical protein